MEGVISVVANCCPDDFTEMINLAMINKYDKARKAHYKLLTGIDLLFVEGNPAGVKAVLSHYGLCQNVLRLPLVSVSDATYNKIIDFAKTIKESNTQQAF
jgi:4-hydroxy-tetrahydrodipicolinate synthase